MFCYAPFVHALPAMFGGGSMNNLALSFGAPRRLCFWGWQLTRY